MTVFEALKQRNKRLISDYEKLGNKKFLERQKAIAGMLENPHAFMDMSVEMAYSVLIDLGIDRRDIMNVYIELLK